MNAHTMYQSYNSYGGHPTLAILGQFIEEHLSQQDHGIAEFESVACFRTKRPPRRTLENSYAQFHNGLKGLPTSRWEAKTSRLVLRYESHLGLAEEIVKNRDVSPDLLQRAHEELIAVVEGLAARLEKKKGLRIGTFIQGLKGLAPRLSTTADELHEFGEQQSAKKREELKKLPWDQQLEIDWDDYHPDAKRLLDDPFFWSCTNDFSPHGNDTGADLLAFFVDWNKKYPKTDSGRFLKDLFDGWGMSESVRRAHGRQPSEFTRDEEIALTVHDEALVALAFAEIKLRGGCDEKLAGRACKRLNRQLEPSFLEEIGWNAPSEEQVEANRRLSAVLRTYVFDKPKRPWWRLWS